MKNVRKSLMKISLLLVIFFGFQGDLIAQPRYGKQKKQNKKAASTYQAVDSAPIRISEISGREGKKATLPAYSPRDSNSQSLLACLKNLAKTLQVRLILHESVEDRSCEANPQDPPLRQFDDLLIRYSLSVVKLPPDTVVVYSGKVEQASQLYDPVVVRNFYLQNVPAMELSQALQGFLGNSNSQAYAVSGVAASNTLTVRAPLCEMSQLMTIINDIDRSPAEAEVEFSVLGIGKETGRNLGRSLGNSPLGSLLSGNVFSVLLQPSSLNLLQSSGQTRLLSSTKVRVQHGQQTVLRLGSNSSPSYSPSFPAYPAGNGGQAGMPGGLMMSSGDSGYYGESSSGPGLSINLHGRIDPSSTLSMAMTVAASNSIASGSSQQYSVSTTASIPDGATVILAKGDLRTNGKIREGIPVINMIPIFGQLFSTNKDRNDYQEMIVTVSSKVIRPQTRIPASFHLRKWCGLTEVLATDEAVPVTRARHSGSLSGRIASGN
jgi:type II secretory pathway component GspD/PulD (secretin)